MCMGREHGKQLGVSFAATRVQARGTATATGVALADLIFFFSFFSFISAGLIYV